MENYPITAYSLRIDVSHNLLDDTEYLGTFYKFLDEHVGGGKYMFAKELKSDGTAHLQGVICPVGIDIEKQNYEAWTHADYEPHELNLIRSKVRLKLVGPNHRGKKGSYSFVKAKKPISLLQYCNDKEGLGVLTNLTDEERENIGKWIDKDTKKKNKKQQLESEIDILGSAVLEGHQTRKAFLEKAIDLYVTTYENLPRATLVEKWLYKYGSNPEEKVRMLRQKYSHLYAGIATSAEMDNDGYTYSM
nr:MAG TPA: Rep protein [Bacteriophage sp.]